VNSNTREENNQKGKDACYDEVSAYVHSPTKFERQRKREIFHRRDGCMVGNANENRFVAFKDMSVVNTKYMKYQSPQFERRLPHNIDEYIRDPSDTANETSNHQDYHPKHHLC